MFKKRFIKRLREASNRYEDEKISFSGHKYIIKNISAPINYKLISLAVDGFKEGKSFKYAKTMNKVGFVFRVEDVIYGVNDKNDSLFEFDIEEEEDLVIIKDVKTLR